MSNGQSASISGFVVDGTSGSLTAVSGSPFAEASAQPLWLAAAQRQLFFSSSTPPGIAAPTVSSSGALSAVSGSGTDAIGGIAAAPSGTALLVSEVGLQKVQAFGLSAGVLTPLGSGAATGTAPSGVVITPSGSFVYAANNGDDTVSAYKFDAGSGNLTANGTVQLAVTGVTTIGPYRMLVDPAGKFLFVSSTAGYVFEFAIDSSGGLTPVGSPLAVAPGDTVAGMSVDPSSKFFYVVDRSAGTMFGYTIATDGTLAAISGFPVNTGSRSTSAPESVVVEPGGKFLFVTNRNDNSVTSFTLGASGKATLLATQTTNIGTTPIDLAIVH